MKNQLQLLMAFTVLCLLSLTICAQSGDPNAYLSWTADQAEQIGKSLRTNGKVGSSWDFRVINTDHAINYKLRATLLTPEVIRAAARLEQLRNRLTKEETKQLVADAEGAGDLTILVEIDPREGSGVIPLDWRVFLQSKNYREGSAGSWAITGVKRPELRKEKALAGVFKRDYNYDVFWVTFRLVDESKKPLVPSDNSEFELFVGIHAKEGRVTWKIPESVKQKVKSLSNQ
jgi:hypothetical protein